jgi:hypothetical protein
MLLLTKPLGVGVMTTALKKGLLPPEGCTEVCCFGFGALHCCCVSCVDTGMVVVLLLQ